MSVSVIIPLFNGNPWIKQAIESVLCQELKVKDIIVVDDGSTDDSCAIVRNYPNVTLLKNDGKGSSAARNLGILNTDSPFLAFLDQDDVWHPKHLKHLHRILCQNPKVNTVFSEASCFETEPEYNLSSDKFKYFEPWERFPFTVGIDGPSLALIRRSAIDKVGLWDQEGTGMGDVLLFLKLAALHPLIKTMNCTVGKRIHLHQQWLKVREDALKYLDFRYTISSLSLEFLKKNSSIKANYQLYDDRLEALKSLREITKAILDEDYEIITPLAIKLEQALAIEDNDIYKHVFYCLMGALFPTYSVEEMKERRDSVFLKLANYWPDDCVATKKALLGLVGEKPRVS